MYKYVAQSDFLIKYLMHLINILHIIKFTINAFCEVLEVNTEDITEALNTSKYDRCSRGKEV